MLAVSDPIVRMTDVQKHGYCIATVKPWFDARGLDWRDFVRNGIAASRLRQVMPEGDLHMENCIASAAEREATSGQQ